MTYRERFQRALNEVEIAQTSHCIALQEMVLRSTDLTADDRAYFAEGLAKLRKHYDDLSGGLKLAVVDCSAEWLEL